MRLLKSISGCVLSLPVHCEMVADDDVSRFRSGGAVCRISTFWLKLAAHIGKHPAVPQKEASYKTMEETEAGRLG